MPDFEGLLPLHQVGCSGFVDICRLLVEAGAPLNLHTIKYVAQEALDAQARKQDPGNKKAKRKQLDVSGLTTIGGNSALALAIRHGHVGIVEYLLSMVREQRRPGQARPGACMPVTPPPHTHTPPLSLEEHRK